MTKVRCMDTLIVIKRFLSKEGLFPVNPYENLSLSKKLFNFCLYACIISILLVHLVEAIEVNNMALFNRMSYTIMLVATIPAKLVAIWWNKDSFLLLLKYLESPAFNIHSEAQNQYIQIVDKLAQMLLKGLAAVITIYMAISTVAPFVMDAEMTIPPPFNMGKYSIFYKIIHFFAAFYLGSNSICQDLLFITLMGLCIAQQNILEQKLLKVDEKALHLSAKTGYSVRFTEKQVLKRCVILHETIHQFVGKLNIILSFPLTLQYTCGCFIICSIIWQVTISGQTDTFGLVNNAAAAMIIISQLACYHWLGNEITFKSSNIIEACYLSNWYNLDHESKMTLLLLMERARHPLPVQLYKFIYISLESLTVIIRWSYSLFALIKARYN